ncbi:hypothetical protein RFH42_03165 [Acinetobacter rudis]|uniref:hypothetical protein n=1 Tax=Acinetobacter rudis TaxID=632955 RepID=UPI00280DBEED|nr:hypothetical protein [Acinetobacter rudis]MDQ8951954.1 hypothetical protein [Acinetobacter rudis]
MMPLKQYKENRLTVVGIEAPDNKSKSLTGTRVCLSNGQYLGDVKDIQLTGGVDNAWKVQVTTSSVLTNEQVSNLFAKGGYVSPLEQMDRGSINGHPACAPKEEGNV